MTIESLHGLIAGCPVTQEIEDNFLPMALGDGLGCGVENCPSTFELQSVGLKGDLAVDIVGKYPTLERVFFLSKLLSSARISIKSE